MVHGTITNKQQLHFANLVPEACPVISSDLREELVAVAQATMETSSTRDALVALVFKVVVEADAGGEWQGGTGSGREGKWEGLRGQEELSVEISA